MLHRLASAKSSPVATLSNTTASPRPRCSPARFTTRRLSANFVTRLPCAGSLGIAVLKAEIDGRTLGFRAPREEIAEAVRLRHQLGLLNLYEGQFAEAVLWFRKAQELGSTRDVPARDRAQRHVLLGLAALKLGKLENRDDGFTRGDRTIHYLSGGEP